MNQSKGYLLLLLVCINQISCITASSSDCGQQYERAESFGPSWQERQHYLPEIMQVTGQATSYLPAEQVIIQFEIETLSDSAGTSLQQNNQSISKATSEMKKIGIEDKELSTQGLRIFPFHRQEYVEATKQYKSIFEGYKVVNNLRIVTKKIELAGKIIDIAVSNGINNVQSVNFSPTGSKIKELKDSLISKAVEDAVSRANLALQPLNYEIKLVKGVRLQNSNYGGRNNLSYLRSNTYQEDDSSEGMADNDSTQLFQSGQKYNVEVDVSFLIGKKETQTNQQF